MQKKQNPEIVYYKCGMKVHCLCTYHTSKHLVDIYQASHNEKGKSMKTNIKHNNLIGIRLDISYFFGNVKKREMILLMMKMSILFNLIIYWTIIFVV